jgi:hypothetical protein
MEAILTEAGVRLTGWVGNDVLQDELDRAWLYLHTSRSEGFPLSLLDAAARDVPIIVRPIAAFDGFDLRTVQTVDDVIDLFTQLVRSPQGIEEIRLSGRRVIAQMTRDESATSLRRAYAATGGWSAPDEVVSMVAEEE